MNGVVTALSDNLKVPIPHGPMPDEGRASGIITGHSNLRQLRTACRIYGLTLTYGWRSGWLRKSWFFTVQGKAITIQYLARVLGMRWPSEAAAPQ